MVKVYFLFCFTQVFSFLLAEGSFRLGEAIDGKNLDTDFLSAFLKIVPTKEMTNLTNESIAKAFDYSVKVTEESRDRIENINMIKHQRRHDIAD